MVTQLAKLRILQVLSLLFSFERPGPLLVRGFVFFESKYNANECGCGLVAQLARAHD